VQRPPEIHSPVSVQLKDNSKPQLLKRTALDRSNIVALNLFLPPDSAIRSTVLTTVNTDFRHLAWGRRWMIVSDCKPFRS